MKITKPVFIPVKEYRRSNLVVDVGRRRIRLCKHMIGEEFRPLEKLGYAIQQGTVDVEIPDPKPRKVEVPEPEALPSEPMVHFAHEEPGVTSGSDGGPERDEEPDTDHTPDVGAPPVVPPVVVAPSKRNSRRKR